MIDKIPSKVVRRIGNWCEESVLREEKLRDFLKKSDNGLLNIKRTEKRINALRHPTDLSSTVQFQSNLMIKNVYTQGFLAIDVQEYFPSVQDSIDVTTSIAENTTNPCIRSTFQLERILDLPMTPEYKPKYGEKVYITAFIPSIEKKLYLATDSRSPTNTSRISKNQPAFLKFSKDYKATWELQYPDPHFRLEMEGTPIQKDYPFLLLNTSTGQHLSSDNANIIRNDFDVEWEVICHSERGIRKQNYWVFN